MTTTSTPDGYIAADAAAVLLGCGPSTISRVARAERWRRLRRGHAFLYLLTDVQTTERTRRTP